PTWNNSPAALYMMGSRGRPLQRRSAARRCVLNQRTIAMAALCLVFGAGAFAPAAAESKADKKASAGSKTEKNAAAESKPDSSAVAEIGGQQVTLKELDDFL